MTSSLNAISAVTWVVPAANHQTVSTRATADAYFGNLVARPIGVVTEYNFATSDGSTCVFGINPSNSEVFAIADNATTSALAAAAAAAAVGDSTTFVMTQTGAALRCVGSALTSTTALIATNNLVSTPDRIGIFTRSASATFDWVMIVSSP